MVDHGIDIAMNVFARDPQIRPEWISHAKGDQGLYTKEEFAKLSKADIDLGKTVIGDKALTEEDFATVALFASLDPEVGAAGQSAAVEDTKKLLDDFAQAGFTEAEAKEIITTSFGGSYTVDILHVEKRMGNYFDSAINGGRRLAQEALTAYPADKSKLAEVMARALSFTGATIGASATRGAEGDAGHAGLAKLCGKLTGLMDRDPELRKLVQEKYEQREQALYKKFNEKILGEDRKTLGEMKPRSFEEQLTYIDDYRKIIGLEEKGAAARQAMATAGVNGVELTKDQKRVYLRDMLKGQLISGIFNEQIKQRREPVKENPTNGRYVKLGKFANASMENEQKRVYQEKEKELLQEIEHYKVQGMNEELEEKKEQLEEFRALGYQAMKVDRTVSFGKGSSMPADMGSLLTSGLGGYFIQRPPVMGILHNERDMAQLDRVVEQIIDHDHLDQQDMEDLTHTCLESEIYNKYSYQNIVKTAGEITQLGDQDALQPKVLPQKQAEVKINQVKKDDNEIEENIPE